MKKVEKVDKVGIVKADASIAATESVADGAAPKCIVVATYGGYTTYCKFQAEMDKYQANTTYHPVESVLNDMAESLAYQQAVQTEDMDTTEFTADAISAMEPDNADTLGAKETAGYQGYVYAVYQGATVKACRKTILDRNADLKAMIERMEGKDADMDTAGSTVTSVLNSIICQYGDDWVDATADPGNDTVMTSVGTCPTTYPGSF